MIVLEYDLDLSTVNVQTFCTKEAKYLRIITTVDPKDKKSILCLPEIFFRNRLWPFSMRHTVILNILRNLMFVCNK